MNKDKIFKIVRFNVEKSIQNKWFVILNLIMCLIMCVVINFDKINEKLKENNIDLFSDKYKIEVLDKTGLANGKLENILSENIEIKYVNENKYDKENISDDLVIVEFYEDESTILKTKIVSKEAIDNELYSKIEEVANDVRTELFSIKNNVSLEKLKNLSGELNVERVMLSVDAENYDTKNQIKTFSILIVYFILIFTLSRIANEIAQEKVSKSIEYVLTSVTAKEYLLAKVLSITLSVLIQMIFSAIYYVLANALGLILDTNAISNSVNSMSSSIDIEIVKYIAVMSVYLIFTVFFMSLLQAAMSAKTTNISEASNTTMTLLTVTIVLYFISLATIDPYVKASTFMYIISCIPIVSTFFVPSMMIIGQATTLQIIGSFIALVLSVPILFNTCAKKFKEGVLDYTEKKSSKSKKELDIKEEQFKIMNTNKINRCAYVIGFSILLWFFIQMIGSFITGIKIESNWFSDKSILLMKFSVLSILSLIIPYVWVKNYTEKPDRAQRKIGFSKGFNYYISGLGIVLGINVIESLIVRFFGATYDVISADMIPGANADIFEKFIFIFAIAIVPGIFEELFFRKGIIDYTKNLGNGFAIILSSILFGMIHQNIQQGIFAFLIGMVFGFIYLKTNNIKVTMFLHFSNNAFAAITMLCDLSQSVYFVIVGILLIISLFITNNSQKKTKGEFLKLEKGKKGENLKLMLKNYTFALAIVLTIILTIVTEKILRS